MSCTYVLLISMLYDFHFVYSGYADRIYELVVVSRELSADDKSSLQRNGNRNCFSEANHIEFSGVKVLEIP